MIWLFKGSDEEREEEGCSRGIERERQRHKEQGTDETGHETSQRGQMNRKGKKNEGKKKKGQEIVKYQKETG